MSDTAVPTPGSKRQRSRQACEPCRLRKRKCNGTDPCSQCVDFEYQCHYVEKSTPAPATKTRRFNHGSKTSDSASVSSPRGGPNHESSATNHDQAGMPFEGHADGVSDPVRAKFAPSESAVAFPRLLGRELSPDRAPRLHCFGWNLGVRSEIPRPDIDITKYLTLSEAKHLSSIYFEVVHPEIGFLDEKVYIRNLDLRWSGRLDARAYDSVIAGVSSLGSFFLGSDGHEHEAQLQNLLAEVLHIYCGIYFPTINHAAAWILRTIYLRLTTRPNASWTASCALAHVLESTGLYKDPTSAPFSGEKPLDVSEIDYRRRLFWTAWFLHIILSKEYGRSRVQLEITTRLPNPGYNISGCLLETARCLETREFPTSSSDKIAVLIHMLDRLHDVKAETDFQQLLKTDMMFAVYRRLRLLQHKISKKYEEIILTAGTASLSASKQLVDSRRPWWNIINCPFQFVCVCLAIDSSESFSVLRDAINTLEHVLSVYDTFMVREALQVAENLVKLARDRKAEDLRKIEACVNQSDTTNGLNSYDDLNTLGVLDDSMLWGWMNDTFAWDLVGAVENNTNGISLHNQST